VLDIRDLGRQAGSLRHVVRQAPAPAGIGTELLGVPAGELVELDLRLEAVVEGVLVSGTVTAPLAGECARCLEPVSDRAAVEIRELFYYPARAAQPGVGHARTTLGVALGRRQPSGGSGDGGDDGDDDAGVVIDDHVDIEPPVRDALVLSLPLSPLCRPDCAGLCVGCGARLDDVDPDHAHSRTDPRWAALAPLIENKEKD
jgi:uncharacterized protein